MDVISQNLEMDVSVARIMPHPENPRIGDVDAIAESIEVNGFYGAVIAQKSTGHILVGNHRYKAALAQGASTIPVIWVDVDDERAIKILLADNRTAELGGYDEAALKDLLANLSSYEGTGYSEEDVAEMLRASLEGAPGTGDTPSGGLSEKFGVPPFTVLSARDGWWQEQKKAWIRLGIRSELGREAVQESFAEGARATQTGRRKSNAPGGSAMPAADYSKSKKRGNSKGQAIG